MVDITACAPPPGSLIETYAKAGEYTDCFTCSLPGKVPLADYIHAFYSSKVFWIERQGLKLLLGKSGTRSDIEALSSGDSDQFSAWIVGAREEDQILLKDVQGNTASWLRVAAKEAGTQLFFGTVVMKNGIPKNGEKQLKPAFSALMGFHKAYSKALLKGAAKGL